MRTVVDEWLEAEQHLPAAERFAFWHERATLEVGARYRDLIPLSAPAAGEQYAFHVDLDACSGCKACVAACHSLNGLDPGETWREVALLVGGKAQTPVLQHVTSACHHCLDPACLEGCPVEAYEKDARTGIVLHLDDQCIGCRYCTLTCPYEAPKYNARLGIVRKCDLCHGRLAAGEAPACVQGCPNEAIRVTVAGRTSASGASLPGAPDTALTRPTTSYVRARSFPADTARADLGHVRPGEAHTPLAVMLVLTQLSVGGFLVGRLVETAGGGVFAPVHGVHSAMSLVLGLVALAASVLHLGRPLQAWRALLGVRRSWLSREILAFAVFAGLAALYAAAGVLAPALAETRAVRGLGAAVVGSGLAGITSSVLLYHRTRRALWRADRTAVRFGLSTLVLGVTVTLLAGLAAAVLSAEGGVGGFLAGWGRPLFAMVAVISIAKLGFEALAFRRLRWRVPGPLGHSAALLAGVLQQTTVARFATGFFGGVLLPAFFFLVAERSSPTAVGVAIVLTFVFVLAGELLERSLFFRASTPPIASGAGPG